MGVPPEETGNGNHWIGGQELQWKAMILNNSPRDSRNIWYDYIYYTWYRYTRLNQANSAFLSSFGSKTFVKFLLEW